MQPSHGVPFFVRSNRNEALHMPIGFCCNLSRVMYGGESTRNLEDAVSVVEGFGVRVEGSFLKWTMGNDSSDKIAHIMKATSGGDRCTFVILIDVFWNRPCSN